MHILKKMRQADEKWKEITLHDHSAKFLCLPGSFLAFPHLLANVHTLILTDYEGFIRHKPAGEDLNYKYVQLPISSTRYVSLHAIRK